MGIRLVASLLFIFGFVGGCMATWAMVIYLSCLAITYLGGVTVWLYTGDRRSSGDFGLAVMFAIPGILYLGALWMARLFI